MTYENEPQKPSARRPIRAFTLVELLVVIGIIALLIGILMPSLSRARAAAKDVACLSNLRALGQGFAIYATTYKNYWPAPASPNNTDRAKSVYWQHYLYRIYNKTEVPAAKLADNTYIEGSVFECPAANRKTNAIVNKLAAIGDQDQQQFSYGMSARIHDLPFVNDTSNNSLRHHFKLINKVRNPALTALLVDNIGAWSGTAYVGGDSQLVRLQAAVGRHSRSGVYQAKGDFSSTTIGGTLKDDGRTNVLYGDYHAAPVPYREIPKSVAVNTALDSDPAADRAWWQFWCGTSVDR